MVPPSLRQQRSDPRIGLDDIARAVRSVVEELYERASSIEAEPSRPAVVGRAALLLILVAMTWGWATQPLDGASRVAPSFADVVLSMANLVFHEAGHVLLGWLGRFMTSLAGSLFQVALPLVLCGAFLSRKHLDPFGAAVTFWWSGQNLVDIAPYINDARAQTLILLGGVTGRDVPGYHDWNVVLGRLGWLDYHEALARGAHGLGTLAMVIALAWGGSVVWRQLRAAPTR